MSYLVATPETVASAASDLAGIGTSISAANSAAGAPITGVIAVAEDEVSAAIASLFSGHGRQFQALITQAAAFQTQFVQALTRARAVRMRPPKRPMPRRCRRWCRVVWLGFTDQRPAVRYRPRPPVFVRSQVGAPLGGP